MLGLAIPVIARRPKGGASAPPPWSPAQLGSKLSGWWDADDAASIVLAPAVSQWSDKSGAARHLAQATAGLQPTLAQNALNGRAGIVFAQKYLACLATTAPLSVAVTAVIVTSGDAATSNNRGLVVLYPPGVSDDYARPTALVAMEQMANGSYQSYANGVTGAASPAGTAGPAGKLLAFEKDASNATAFRLNGALAPSAGASFAGNDLSTARSILVGGRNVGGVNVANYGFSGAMHEIVLANVLLTLADRQKLEGYLAGKWGLRPLLPAAHPYKSTTP